MTKNKFVWTLATALVLVGALNWGLVGAFNVDLVKAIFGESVVSNVVYILVGLAGLWKLVMYFMKKDVCGCCGKNPCSCGSKSTTGSSQM